MEKPLRCIDHAERLSSIEAKLESIHEDIQDMKVLYKDGMQLRGAIKLMGIAIGAAWVAISSLIVAKLT